MCYAYFMCKLFCSVHRTLESESLAERLPKRPIVNEVLRRCVLLLALSNSFIQSRTLSAHLMWISLYECSCLATIQALKSNLVAIWSITQTSSLLLQKGWYPGLLNSLRRRELEHEKRLEVLFPTLSAWTWSLVNYSHEYNKKEYQFTDWTVRGLIVTWTRASLGPTNVVPLQALLL